MDETDVSSKKIDKTDRDNLVLKQSTTSQESPSEPFLEKKLVYKEDNNNSSNYSTNQIEIDMNSWSTSGAFFNHSEGFMIIPIVFHLNSNKDLTSSGLDLKIKSDNLHFINSVAVDYNNSPLVQANVEISPYLDFLKKTTCSYDEESLLRHTGFRRNEEDWDFDPHYGVYNKHLEFLGVDDFYSNSDTKQVLYGSDYDKLKCINYVEKTTNDHYYYYNCFIRMKDLPFMNSMTLTRGATLKLTLTLNQLDMVFKNEAGTITQNTIKKGHGTPFLIDNTKLETLLSDPNDNLTIKCGVAQIGDHKHALSHVRLYSPAYTLTPLIKSQIQSSPQRKLVFNDVYINHIRRIPKGNFNYSVNNNITRVKRLIIFPLISSNTSETTPNGNGLMGFDSLSSPFYDSAPAPVNIENFNVSVSGLNVYTTNKKFKFENYLDELDCKFGVEAGLENGMTSGVFGLKEYQNNHNYIVVDLSRKLPFDENINVSIDISGENKGTRDLDFICYLEIEKDITLDVFTGQHLK